MTLGRVRGEQLGGPIRRPWQQPVQVEYNTSEVEMVRHGRYKIYPEGGAKKKLLLDWMWVVKERSQG